MAAYEGTSDGGAGGKFRKRPFRRPTTTPYDRPPTALRPTQNPNNNGWFSKIVDPASRLITTGAHKLFSSFFNKRLLPPPPPPQQPPDECKEIEDIQPEAGTHVVASATKEPISGGGNNAGRNSESKGVADLVEIMKQKTFTRSEMDHLTSLLQSRTVENSDGANKRRSELKFSGVLAADARRETLFNMPDHGTRINHVIPEAIATPEARSEDVISSPADIAKAYMGGRPGKPSTSALGLQNQTSKADLPSPYDPFSKQISADMSLIRKPPSDFGASGNGLLTPRFRGRSAIYSMARTPYSRAHAVTAIKGGETYPSVNGGLSLFRNGSENNQSERQVLKRRSSVLENDIGSVGPIRRIRQKPNLLHPKILSLPPPSGRCARNVSEVLTDVEAPSPIEWESQNHSSSKLLTHNDAPSSGGGYVPLQSVETAQKIFKELDKFTAKGKSPEKKTESTMGNSPTKTRFGLLDASAHENLGTDNSSKSLQNAQGSIKVNGLFDGASAQNHSLNPYFRDEDVSLKKPVVPSDKLATQNDMDCRITVSPVAKNTEIVDNVVTISAVERPQKKRAFQMSALEDCPEFDDDVPPKGGVLSVPLTERIEHDESPKSAAIFGSLPRNETIAVENCPGSNLAESLTLPKDPESQTNCSVAVASSAITSSSVVPSSSPTTRVTTVTEQEATIAPQKPDRVGAQNEANNTFLPYNFNSSKLPSRPTFNSPAPVTSIAAKDSVARTSESGSDAAAKSNGPDKIDSKNAQGFGNTSMKSGDFPHFMTAANGTRSYGLQTNNSTPSNGLQIDGTVLATNQSSADVSVSSPLLSGNLKMSNGSVGPTTSSAGNTSISSSITGFPTIISDISSTKAVPHSFTASAFSSSTAPSTDTNDASTVKSNNNGLGNTAGIPGASPFASASGGSGISVFSDSALKAIGGDAQTAGQSGVRGAAVGFQTNGGTSGSVLTPIFGLTASSVSAPASTSSGPFLAPNFGMTASSVSAPTSTSASVLSLSAPFTTNLSSSSAAGSFGSSTSIFCSTANSFSSLGSTSSALGSSSTTSVPTSIVTGGVFGWQPSKPTTLDSTSTLSTPSSAFVLGGLSSGSSAATSSSFVFGAGSNSSSTASAPAFAFGSSIGTAAPIFPASSSAPSQPAITSSLFQSQPPFGNASSQPLAFGSSPSTNSDQMTMEDSMAEDSMQPSAVAVPAFVPSISTPSGGFSFNASTPAAGNPFQFNTPQIQFGAPSNISFQPTGSLEFNGGHANSFSLGTTDGGDKSQRRIIKPKRRTGRK